MNFSKPPGNADRRKGLKGRAIRKNMKTKGEQIALATNTKKSGARCAERASYFKLSIAAQRSRVAPTQGSIFP
jgi:hypothetical protein